jgi:hypothetical protein
VPLAAPAFAFAVALALNVAPGPLARHHLPADKVRAGKNKIIFLVNYRPLI